MYQTSNSTLRGICVCKDGQIQTTQFIEQRALRSMYFPTIRKGLIFKFSWSTHVFRPFWGYGFGGLHQQQKLSSQHWLNFVWNIHMLVEWVLTPRDQSQKVSPVLSATEQKRPKKANANNKIQKWNNVCGRRYLSLLYLLSWLGNSQSSCT